MAYESSDLAMTDEFFQVKPAVREEILGLGGNLS
jgi:hypothetical protein